MPGRGVHCAAHQVVAVGVEPCLDGAEHCLPVPVQHDPLQAVAVHDEVVDRPVTRNPGYIHHLEAHGEPTLRPDAPRLCNRFRYQVNGVDLESALSQIDRTGAYPGAQFQYPAPVLAQAKPRNHVLQKPTRREMCVVDGVAHASQLAITPGIFVQVVSHRSMRTGPTVPPPPPRWQLAAWAGHLRSAGSVPCVPLLIQESLYRPQGGHPT